MQFIQPVSPGCVNGQLLFRHINSKGDDLSVLCLQLVSAVVKSLKYQLLQLAIQLQQIKQSYRKIHLVAVLVLLIKSHGCHQQMDLPIVMEMST